MQVVFLRKPSINNKNDTAISRDLFVELVAINFTNDAQRVSPNYVNRLGCKKSYCKRKCYRRQLL